MKTIVCDCGRIHWRGKRQRRVYEYLSRERTTREVADEFAWTVQNANNHLRALVALGVAEIVREQVQPTGGVENVWRAK